jgi:predicted Zn-ribbon and HTH transcriptional regulator
MHTHGEFERLRGVLADSDEPLTAREILAVLDDADEFDSAHRVATVLGRHAERGEVEVVRGNPYRYDLAE